MSGLKNFFLFFGLRIEFTCQRKFRQTTITIFTKVKENSIYQMKLNPKWLKLDNAWVRNIIPQSRLKHDYPIERPRSRLTDAVLPQRRDWFTFTVYSTSIQEANTKFWHWNWKLTKTVVKRSNDRGLVTVVMNKTRRICLKKSLQTTQTATVPTQTREEIRLYRQYANLTSDVIIYQREN